MGEIISMPLEEIDGLQVDDPIVARSEDARVPVAPSLLGRVLDGFSQPMDSGPRITEHESYALYRRPPNPLEREHITECLTTGVRAIDSILYLCGKSDVNESAYSAAAVSARVLCSAQCAKRQLRGRYCGRPGR